MPMWLRVVFFGDINSTIFCESKESN
jgi:hypothetical protein